MSTDPHAALLIGDGSGVGEARRAATALASSIGFDDSDTGRVGLVVTEAATNIVKHARSGQLLMRPLRDAADRVGIELLALDRGPGIADVERSKRDGYSTAGSPGNGLGAIARLASLLDIYSLLGSGTALLIRVLQRGAVPATSRGPLVIGAVRVAAPGETESGDDWAFFADDRRAVMMVVDGLGHGPHAAKAAHEAVRVFEANHSQSAERILQLTHAALLPTRGAAVAVAEVDLAARQLQYAALGNISAAIVWAGGSRNMIGQNGTAGGEFRRIRPITYPWTSGGAIVMHSDGLASHLNLQAYPGLIGRHPSLVAGVLYRDFTRGRDDATVVVARELVEAT
jgi:anti-sigma regulatory factor (Ser/Thr protein kinase)